MRLTIIADDKCISIDGEGYDGIYMPELPANIHALQWYETFGEVEFKTELRGNKFVKPENQIIVDLDDYGWVVEKHAAARQAYEESIARESGDSYGWGTPVDTPIDNTNTNTNTNNKLDEE